MDFTATADSNLARSIDSTKPIESTLQRWINFLRVELAPLPGRAEVTIRLVLAVTAALIFSLSLRVPSTAISIYVLFFVFQDDSVTSTKIGVLAMVGLTLIVGVLLLVSISFVDANAIRVPVIFALLWGSMFLSRVLVLGVLGRLFAVIIVMFLMLSDGISRGDQLVRATLYFWPIIGISVGSAGENNPFGIGGAIGGSPSLARSGRGVSAERRASAAGSASALARFGRVGAAARAVGSTGFNRASDKPSSRYSASGRRSGR